MAYYYYYRPHQRPYRSIVTEDLSSLFAVTLNTPLFCFSFRLNIPPLPVDHMDSVSPCHLTYAAHTRDIEHQSDIRIRLHGADNALFPALSENRIVQ
ncbi:hypothetical protein PILCRDRAFT_701653 [Piloderma croceum F 1598]|uniref:Uncharacterized protein n=1 Tax=Piloderma croceum (strain F 1598) TaxID=765440 RepID=A0A0C3AKW7_PILCF|nr:hypothetical protein PILCRDRAFT_701653 [Piloderma croceum F 1598]